MVSRKSGCERGRFSCKWFWNQAERKFEDSCDRISGVAEIRMHYTPYMHRTIIHLLLLAALCLMPAFAADIDGKWTATYDTQNGSITTTWDLKADGTKLTGKASSSFGDRAVTEGKIEGKEVSWVEVIDAGGTSIKVVCKGTLNGDEIKLSRTVGEFGTTETVAKRVK